MKLINKFKSNNFDTRKSNKISHIIVHYTALDGSKEAIEYLCDPKNKVSSHYFISKQGFIYNLVDEKKRAWHAGESYWDGKKDINSCSIGVELDYNPKKNKYYKKKLVISLMNLILKLKKKYKIHNKNILGHSDIAPYRKIDPGKYFPWNKINALNNFKKTKVLKNIENSLEIWFKKNNLIYQKRKILFMLAFIGYEVEPSIDDINKYNNLLKSYSYRFINFNKLKLIRKKRYSLIKRHFIKEVLTFKVSFYS